MKKYFFIAAAAVAALASCSKVTMDDSISNQEINFQVANYVAGTKANSSYSENIPFGAYAWFTQDNGQDMQDFMVDQKISCQRAGEGDLQTEAAYGKVWKADGAQYYWPRTGSLTFVSYSPFAMSEKINVSPASVAITEYDAIADITVNNEVAPIMVADKVSGVTKETNADGSTITATGNDGAAVNNFAGVPTLFRQTLAKVNVVIAAANGISAKVTNVAFSNLYKEGSVEMTADAAGKWAPEATEITLSDASKVNVSVWEGTAAQEATDYSFDENFTVATALDATEISKVACANAKDVIVIPQVLGADQKIAITAEVTVTTPTGSYTYTHTFEGVLKSDNLPAWEINKNITYTIMIGQGDEITFDPAVVNWEDVTANGVVVNS